ncbi:MAG: hypothetical protein K2X27_11045 [Candidatus Obscuribacterales bacterium]|nr:hypothetical protein [Candidatus Obscuribacterales bacterium]
MDKSEAQFDETISKAAELVKNARSLIITAGAGMGVDSGLPDFRGDSGFWQAYPLYEKLGINFVEMATPRHFQDDPEFGWGFYGHRSELYRKTVPHEGFSILRNWIERFAFDSFVVTSNVDGQFQKAAFPEDRIVEVHGSIHFLQCQSPCTHEIWENDVSFEIDLETMRSKNLPRCSSCLEPSRPNVLMFNDWWWLPVRTNKQQKRFEAFISTCKKPLLVLELGAGTSVPTIRHAGETLGRRHDATVIRINPREAQIPGPHLSIDSSAAIALKKIEYLLSQV